MEGAALDISEGRRVSRDPGGRPEGVGGGAEAGPASGEMRDSSDSAVVVGGTGGGSVIQTDGGQERVPLKTVLQNFLNHVEDLETRRREGDDAYEKEFQSLKLFSDQIKCQGEYSCSEGEKDVNRKKNRYKDILPFDYTRVALSEFPGIAGSEYINANFIKGASGSNAYIACQGPLPHTVNDFWRMVVECEVQVIVMACNEQEAGKHKCEKYWTDVNDQEDQPFGKYNVTLLKSREICPDFLVRTMRLRWKNGAGGGGGHGGEGGEDSSVTDGEDGGEFDEERTVCQFHYSAWPDHGIPTQVKPLLEMVRLIRDCQASETLPVLVHCSAGCGRTGTICAIDFIWGLLRTGKLTSDFSLYQLVKDMRKQRIAMVQTVDQYVLVHRAVKELFLEQLRVIDAHPYENVDDDGRPLCGVGSSGGGGARDDDVVPDYETIFVKQQGGGGDDHVTPIDSIEIDKILTNRMHQNLFISSSSSGGGASDTPPHPPPKQRNLDANVVDTREIVISPGDVIETSDVIYAPKKKPEPVLFEPPSSKGTPDKESTGVPQRFKKGNLRLTQTKDGDWKLEELEDDSTTNDNNKPADELNGAIPSAAAASSTPAPPALTSKEKKKHEGGGSKKSRKSRDHDGSSNSNGNDVSPPKSSELLRKPSIKKIKAFFNKDKDSSKDTNSAPSSADHSPQNDSDVVSAISKLPKFEPDAKIPAAVNVPNSKSVPSSLDRKSSEHDSVEFGKYGGGKSHFQKQDSSEQLSTSFTTTSSTSGGNGGKPVLPVKRSKSMKSGLSGGGATSDGGVGNNPSVIYLPETSRFSATATAATPPVVGDASINYNPLPKPKRTLSSEYANVSRNAMEGGAGPEAQALKDRQDFVMASFDMAEREGQRLMVEQHQHQSTAATPVTKLKNNRSAENSPMATMNKVSPYRSSHSSPSNSFNKYNSHHSSPGGSSSYAKSSPGGGGVVNRSPQGSYNRYSPPSKLKPLEASDTRSYARNHRQDTGSTAVHDYANVAVLAGVGRTKSASTAAVPNYENIAIEAQRKVSAAVVGTGQRERRNSFREAVESGGARGPLGAAGRRKKPYESIWFSKGGEDDGGNDNSEDDDDDDEGEAGKSVYSSGGGGHHYANADLMNTVQYLPAGGEDKDGSSDSCGSSGLERGAGERVSGGHGYEPVNFKDGGVMRGGSKAHHNSPPNLQSVSLVSEVINNSNNQHRLPPYSKSTVKKQNSNSSAASSGVGSNGKGPPPPYKQPPMVPPIQQQSGAVKRRPSPVGGASSGGVHNRRGGGGYLANHQQQQHQGTRHLPPASQRQRSSVQVDSFHHYQNVVGGTSTYANVPFRHLPHQGKDRAFARPQPNTTNDDLALTYYQQHQHQLQHGQQPPHPLHRPYQLNTSYNESSYSNNSNNNNSNRQHMTMGNGTNGSAAAALLLTRPPPPTPLQSKQSINPNRFSYGDFAAINHYYDGGGPVDSPPDVGLTVKALPPGGGGTNRSPSGGGKCEPHQQHLLDPSSSTQAAMTSSSGRPVPPPLKHGSCSTGDLLPGIDLDTVAAMMQGSNRQEMPNSSMSVSMSALANIGAGSGARPLGKTIAGVLSGAAANLRSRFSNLGGGGGGGGTGGVGGGGDSPSPPPLSSALGSSSGHHTAGGLSGSPSRTPSSGAAPSTTTTTAANNGAGQVSPSELPMTVPGAAAAAATTAASPYHSSQAYPHSSTNSNQPPYPYSFPQRPDARPGGPRDVPQHFQPQQRKQEYL